MLRRPDQISGHAFLQSPDIVFTSLRYEMYIRNQKIVAAIHRQHPIDFTMINALHKQLVNFNFKNHVIINSTSGGTPVQCLLKSKMNK